MKLKTSLVFSLCLVGALLAGLTVAAKVPFPAGLIGFVIYFTGISLALGSILFKPTFDLLELGWSALVAFFLFSILGTMLYYPFGLTSVISVLLLIVPLALFIITPREIIFSKFNTSKEVWPDRILFVVCLILDCILLALMYKHRTTGVMNSPWRALNIDFFLTYLLATILLIIFVARSKKVVPAYIATALHLFTTYSVAAIIYPLGFGFDGFIHRATEVWIQQNGFILPKQPVYIGQYSLIVWLSNLTRLPIFYIDVYLVPALAALTLPLAVGSILKKVWSIDLPKAFNFVWIFPFIYFLSLQLTTPHNVLILLTMLVVLATLGAGARRLPWIIPLLLAVAGLSIHPLLGAPLFIFVVTAWLLERWGQIKNMRRGLLSLYGLVITFLFPALFTLYIQLTYHQWPAFRSLRHSIGFFIALFRHPYWYARHAPLRFELLYQWERWLPLVVVGIGLIGLYRKRSEWTAQLALVSLIAFCAGAFFLRSWIVFPNVGPFEQGDYPLRLLKTSLIFISPWVMLALYEFWLMISARLKSIGKNASRLSYAVTISGTATLLMLSFYLSYPQENAKVHFPGFNVTAADTRAVEWIQNDNTEYNYVVLSNPIVAVAALSKYSFAKYYPTPQGAVSYYAIPSGGPLAGLYETMWSKDQSRATMNQAMDLVGVQKSYFVINSYWSHFNQIVTDAKKTADAAESIEGGKIWIFTYYRYLEKKE